MKDIKIIKDTLGKEKSVLFKQYNIKKMAIFGSYVKNKQQSNSDIDILVQFKQPVGIEFIDLAEHLESLLKIRVDLVSKNGIKPKYYKVIKNELIYV